MSLENWYGLPKMTNFTIQIQFKAKVMVLHSNQRQILNRFLVSDTVLLHRWESETKIWFDQKSWWRLNYNRESLGKADVSSVSPSSERIEGYWGVVGLYDYVRELCQWWRSGWINLWNERRSLIPCGESVPSWKINFCSRVLQLSVFPWCNDSTHIVMLWWEWLGRLKWCSPGFDDSECFFSIFSLNRSSYIACRLCNRWHLRRCM